jgi:hypothetical protein
MHSQLMTNTKAAMINPMSPKPRDWIGSVKKASADGKFVIIPVSFASFIPVVLVSHTQGELYLNCAVTYLYEHAV